MQHRPRSLKSQLRTANRPTKVDLKEACRRDVLDAPGKLPTLPTTVSQVMQLINEPDVEIESVEELLKNDATLVASLLRLANSPLYSSQQERSSIGDAIMAVGLRGLRSMLMFSGSAKLLKQDYSCYGHGGEGLWLHSLVTAVSGRKLAKRLGLGAAFCEEVFTAGLLHDIGKFMLSPYADKAAKAGRGIDLVDHETEQALLSVDHQEVGAKIAEHWGLGGMVQSVLANHHAEAGQITDVPEEHRKHLATVRLADWIAHEHGAGFAREVPRKPSSSLAEDLTLLALDEETWFAAKDEILAGMDESLSEITH